MDFKHVPSIIAIVKTFKNKPCRKTEIVFPSSNKTNLEIPSQSSFLINLLYQKGNAFLLSKNTEFLSLWPLPFKTEMLQIDFEMGSSANVS